MNIMKKSSITTNLIDCLFHRRCDPTYRWGRFSPPIPDIDLAEMRFGTLRFGEAFDAAAFLGRPDRVAWPSHQYCELLYACGGFQLDFDNARFAYIAFFIGPDDDLPKHPALAFSGPRVRGVTSDAIPFGRNTDQPFLEKIFGAPMMTDSDSEEVILYYTRHSITMEFEMDGTTKLLKRWNLYPTQSV